MNYKLPQQIETVGTAAVGKFIFTITNNKGCLSKKGIDCMVYEIKKYKGKIAFVFHPAYNILIDLFLFYA